MRGNVSTAERSSIGRSPIIGETASPLKPRKKSKRPPCNTGAGRHRNSGTAYARVNSERAGVLGYIPGKQLSVYYIPHRTPHRSSILAVFSLLSSAISHRPKQSFNLTRQRSERGGVTKPGNPLASIPSRVDSLSHSEMVLVRHPWMQQESPVLGARYSNFASPIGWCLDQFRRYDGPRSC